MIEAENVKTGRPSLSGKVKVMLSCLALIAACSALCLIFGVLAVKLWNPLGTDMLHKIHKNLTSKLDNADDKEALDPRFKDLTQLSEQGQLSFIALTVITSAHETTTRDGVVKETEVKGLIELLDEILEHKGQVSMDEVQSLTARAQGIR